MRVKRCVLQHDMFGNPNAERREIPYRLNSALDHEIGNFLRNIGWNGENPNLSFQFFVSNHKFIRMKHRNLIDFLSYHRRIHIKSGVYL